MIKLQISPSTKFCTTRDCPIFAVPAGPDDGTALYRYRRGSDQSNHTFSEDCLSLNVWAKPSDGHSPPKAVMVWIYGGGALTHLALKLAFINYY